MSAVITAPARPRRARADATLVAAEDVATSALAAQTDAGDVGEHLGHVVEGERVLTHRFACHRPGYDGWVWEVTLARAPRQRAATVDEVVLVPGDEAITAPAWVPYRERIQPGDLSPGDLLPVEDDDPRLVPCFSYGDDPLDADDKAQVREVASDLGLGRVRTLSREGRDAAAERWYDSDAGPEAPLARSAPAPCGSCGFLLRLAGPLSGTFGVCANGDANDDGRVVAIDHGCGAHSEARLGKRAQPVPLPDHVWDTVTVDGLDRA
ncbi:hypothetical protein GCM10009737_31790 [Nocardioides lentus]|uniref:DUF3027 domain-containing protein n=1 Tax=Nocardioides lentus TaxID=338077 RepID=A0ABN2PST8_9ACTN